MASRRSNLTGQLFGLLRVVAFAHVDKGGNTYWLCSCDCGKTSTVRAWHLLSGETKSCGHLRGEDTDLTGNRFGKLAVLSSPGRDQRGNRLWLCRCDCGTGKVIPARGLKDGSRQSCGCLTHRNQVSGTIWKHPAYTQWRSMIDRCYRKAAINYPEYGGKGFSICEFLRASPVNLIVVLGPMIAGTSVDRIDNAKGYSCGQCSECAQKDWPLNLRWATKFEQSQNRSTTHWITINGVRRCVSEWSRVLKINRRAVVRLYEPT